jgi:hypothetical protein
METETKGNFYVVDSFQIILVYDAANKKFYDESDTRVSCFLTDVNSKAIKLLSTPNGSDIAPTQDDDDKGVTFYASSKFDFSNIMKDKPWAVIWRFGKYSITTDKNSVFVMYVAPGSNGFTTMQHVYLENFKGNLSIPDGNVVPSEYRVSSNDFTIESDVVEVASMDKSIGLLQPFGK